MGKYGEAAVRAVGLILWEPETTPPEAWAAATERVFPTSPSGQEKGCPKGAFLGLCEEGVVAGVSPGSFTRSELNKSYALRALAALREKPDLADDEAHLWELATPDREIRPNSQMDVVTSLWGAGLIR